MCVCVCVCVRVCGCACVRGCGYGLWITYRLQVVLAVGALEVDGGALQCTQFVGKRPLGALLGASWLRLWGRASVPHTQNTNTTVQGRQQGCFWIWIPGMGVFELHKARIVVWVLGWRPKHQYQCTP